MTLKDVRSSIGKDREQWKVALESELQSLKDTGAIHAVNHVPRGTQVLPMKVLFIEFAKPSSKLLSENFLNVML